MLFMSELSPLNCEILKLLFGNNLNLYNGDTLALAGSDNIKTTNGKKIKIKSPHFTIELDMDENFNILAIHETERGQLDIDNEQLIDAFLKMKVATPNRQKTKTNGEVFTPKELINEMLDKLPEKVWENSELKWFDPAVGTGQFMISVYRRLMTGLQKEIHNKAKRKNHILENMLYMSELDEQNYLECKKIFGNDCNIFKGSTLEHSNQEFKFAEQFGISKFDVIVGNPPYNDNSGNTGTAHQLWTHFVRRSINDWLNENGHLSFVNPSGWRQPDNPIGKLIKDNNLIYLEIHNEKDGKKIFNANTRYDWYVLQKTKNYTHTVVKDQTGVVSTINIRNWPFIPNYLFTEIQQLIDSDEKINLVFSASAYHTSKSWISHHKTEQFKYPVVYSVNRKNELTVKWSEINNKGIFGIPKLIFGSGATGFYIDENGTYGLTQWATGISDQPNNLKKIKTFLESNNFKNIIKAISVGQAEINRKILQYFNKNFYETVM